MAVGGAGVIASSVPLATAGGSLAVIGHALALAVSGAPTDPVSGILLGAGLVVLLALVHLARRTRGADVAAPVVAAELRRWLAIVGVGVVAAIALSAGAAQLASAVRGASLPIVVAAAALGATMVVAGAIAMIARGRDSSSPADE